MLTVHEDYELIKVSEVSRNLFKGFGIMKVTSQQSAVLEQK